MVTLEDFSGELQILFMGKAYLEFADQLTPDGIVAIRGRLNVRDDGLAMHAYSVKTIDVSVGDDGGELIISVSETRATESTMGELRDILERHRGPHPVKLKLQTGEAVRVFELPMSVHIAGDLYGELKGLLGPRCL